MKTDNILKQYELDGGLEAILSDVTRHYFGGYYHVRMLITADVAVMPKYFDSLPVYEDALLHLGSKVQFSRILEKMAVPDVEIAAVRQSLMESFEENLLPYMSRSDFSGSLVNSEYAKALKNKFKCKRQATSWMK